MSSQEHLWSPVTTVKLKLLVESSSSLAPVKQSKKSKPQEIGSLHGGCTHKQLRSLSPTEDQNLSPMAPKFYRSLQPWHRTAILTSSHLTRPSECGLGNAMTFCSPTMPSLMTSYFTG